MHHIGRAVAGLIIAWGVTGCTAVGVATTAVGVTVGVGAEIVETGVDVGVGTTRFVTGAVMPGGDTCDDTENDPEEEGDVCEGED
jgi:hypothetical protein